MLDEIIAWLFWGVIGNVFLRLGRFYIRVFSMGHIRVESTSEAVLFAVSLIGLFITLGLIGISIFFFA